MVGLVWRQWRFRRDPGFRAKPRLKPVTTSHEESVRNVQADNLAAAIATVQRAYPNGDASTARDALFTWGNSGVV